MLPWPTYLLTMAFLIVLVDLAFSFVPGLFVRAVAKRLVFGKPAHANPDGCLLRLDLERALGGFGDFAHTDSNPDRSSLQILFCQGRCPSTRSAALLTGISGATDRLWERQPYRLLKAASTALAKSDSAGPSGATSLAAALAAAFPWLMEIPRPAHLSMATSFSPSPKASTASG